MNICVWKNGKKMKEVWKIHHKVFMSVNMSSLSREQEQWEGEK